MYDFANDGPFVSVCCLTLFTTFDDHPDRILRERLRSKLQRVGFALFYLFVEVAFRVKCDGCDVFTEQIAESFPFSVVFGDIIRSVYSLKHGDFDQDDRTSDKPVPKKIIIFVDELNKYAPSTSSKNSPLLANLLDITERGRSEGVILFSAEQFRSAIHDRIKGNCGTNIYGRTNAIEVSRPDYKFVPSVYANMMTRLKKGDLIVHHPVFKTLLKIQFPFPSYNQGGSK